MAEIIQIVVFFGITIFVHELGHFIAAKAVGFRVESFAIGWGPKLFSFKHNGTEYFLNLLIILGGYVKIAGEHPGEADPSDSGAFINQHPAKRIAAVSAGVVMNFIFAIFLMWIVFFAGVETLLPKIGEAKEGYPAYAAGLKKGDLITEINARKIRHWEDLTDEIARNRGDLYVKAKRGDKVVKFVIKPRIEETQTILGEKIKRPFIGITPAGEYGKEKYTAFKALNKSVKQTFYFSELMLKSIYRMLTGKMAPDLAGPIGVVHLSYKVAKAGFVELLMFFAIINISLALMNFLPVPPLDGGLVLLFVIEAITGKAVPQKVQNVLMEVGWMLLIALLVFVTYKDVARFFTGGHG
jgi:regulator of sigma E protease